MKIFYAQLIFCLTIFFTIQTTTYAAAVIDRVFGTNGTATTMVGSNLQAKKVKIQPDGKILVLGTVGSGTSQDTALARYNSNGTLDSNFGNNGIVIAALSPNLEAANDLALQSDGKIIIVGNIYSPSTGSVDFSTARFNQNGTLDMSFGTNGVATVNQGSTDSFYGVVVQPDGKIVAVGHTSDGDRAGVIRFNGNGTLDTGFANNGLFYFTISPFSNNDSFFAVALFPNGRILLGGTASDTLGTDILALLEPNGTLAQDFGRSGYALDFSDTSPGSAFELVILPDGKFLAISRLSLRRCLSNGAVDQSFRSLYTTGGTSPNAAGTDFAARSDGKIIVLNQRSGSRPDTVVYDRNGRDVNRVKSLGGADIAVQSDDKFVIINSTADSFMLTRYISISSPGTRIADFDFDGKTDLIVSRLGQTVYVLRSSQNVTSYQMNRNSGEGVHIIPEDYSFFNPDQFPLFYWRYPTQNAPAFFDSVTPNGNISSRQWGVSGDIPVGGDYDGESIPGSTPSYRRSTELAIFRPSAGDWWIFNQLTNTYSTYHWGANGDKPVPADYDYDGITDFAVYRPSTGTWWVHRSGDDSYFTINFGNSSDIPLTGDYDGDGQADFTVYRASEGNWYQYLTTEGFRVVRFGLSTDIPVPGDYDGDGKHDVAVFREGLWYLLQSTEGFKVVQWGTAGDNPVAVRYDQ